MNRTHHYLNLAHNFSQLMEQMQYSNVTLTLRPQIVVCNCDDIQIRFCLTLDDTVQNRSVELTDKGNSIAAAVDVRQLLEWAALLQHRNRPADNAAYILNEEESILYETVGNLLAGSPVAETIRNWWKNFTTKEPDDMETLS